jgi:hypothetical protein
MNDVPLWVWALLASIIVAGCVAMVLRVCDDVVAWHAPAATKEKERDGR